MKKFQFSVFTKAWNLPIAELGILVREMGFDAVELPVRDGYPVSPENAAHALPDASQKLQTLGIHIASIAADPDENLIAACGAASVPIIRTMVRVHDFEYMSTVRRTQQEFNNLLPALKTHKVALGVQNHSGDFVANAMGLKYLVESFDPRQICAILDVGHNALDGEKIELAIDILLPHLGMVNLKNAVWRDAGPSETGLAQEWTKVWTLGHLGYASWPRTAAELMRRGWSGTLCLSAEYTDGTAPAEGAIQDLETAKHCFGVEE